MDKPTRHEVEIVSTKRKIIVLILALVIIVGVAGVIVWQQFYKPEKAIAGPISVIDDVGRSVTITGYPPERIVSLAPTCTYILFALELESKLVGVDEFAYYPPEIQQRIEAGIEAGNLTTVGQYATISIETVVGLQPDLILASMIYQHPIAESLEEFGQPVIVLNPEKFDEVLADISLVGKATDQIDKAKALVTDIQKKAQETAEKTQDAPRPRVYVEHSFDGGYYTFGGGSFADELIYMAGGINVFSGFGGAYMATSTEEVLMANPEIIIISKGSMAIACGLSPETIRKRPGWSEIYAVQNDQIYEMDERLLIPGPEIMESLEELARIIHPEIFK
jgi:iron complex transport system substrate-binding protein